MPAKPDGGPAASAPARPLLFLDVDGVLNPFAARGCPDGYREYGFFPDEEPVRLSAVHGTWLAALGRVFDPVWATGWGGPDANRCIAPALHLPQFPAVVFPPAPFPAAAKVPAISAYAEDRPAAWSDDAHAPEARRWARTRTAPTLLVPADPSRGMTEQDVHSLLAWAAGTSTRA
ncbi:HAD domain-containing protein [Nocardiopsis coralliicola]